MFFTLSKTVSLLALPSNFLIGAGLLGLLLLRTRWHALGKRLAYGALILLAVFGFLPAGTVLSSVLENRFPAWSQGSGPPPAGIIVLGGSIDPDLSLERGEPVIGASLERLTVVPKLARQFPQARIVFSGGNGALLPGAGTEADVAATVFEQLGIPRSRVELERASRNTIENAIFTRELVKPKPGERWLLVTSAMHMPRAIGCFRAADFPVEAYPVDWHTGSHWAQSLWPSSMLSIGLARLDAATREWIGLAVYRMTGRSSALLPGPNP